MLKYPNLIFGRKKLAGVNPRLRAVLGGILSLTILFALITFGFNFDPAPATLKATVTESETVNPPLVDSITPLSGEAGDLVYITGKNFASAAAENTVKIGNKTASINTIGYATDDTMTIVAVVPSIETAGDYPLTVATVAGTAIGASTFTIVDSSSTSGVPTITQLDPLSGEPKSTLYIHGTNFSATAAENVVEFVRIGGSTVQPTAVEVVYLDSTRTLKVPVPPRATTGHVTVTVDGIVADSGLDFTVLRTATSADDPQITSISNSEVEFGERIVVKGKNLIDATTGVDGVSVAFNEVAAEIQNFSVDAQGNDALLVEIPINARSGYLTITRAGKTAFSPGPIIILSEPIEEEIDIAELIQPASEDIAESVPEPIFEPSEMQPEAPISLAPTPPADFTILTEDNDIHLSWSAADLPTNYFVYYSTTSGRYLHRLLAGEATEFLVNENLSTGTRYFFIVTAVDTSGHESEPSREMSVIAPPKFTPLIAALRQPMTPTILEPPIKQFYAAAPPQLSEQGPAETILFAGILTIIATSLFLIRRKFATEQV